MAGAVLVAGAAVVIANSGGGGSNNNDSNNYQSTCKYNVNGTEITREAQWGSCPEIVYEMPLMCSSYSTTTFSKYCDEKACGNSCISIWKTCHVGKGTACNNSYRSYP